MEELVTALLEARTFEFKALFLAVHSSLKEKKTGSVGEEMLRLRMYEKLQSLVREGSATKVAGRYKGVRDKLLIVVEQLKERRRPYIPGNTTTGTQDPLKKGTPPSPRP